MQTDPPLILNVKPTNQTNRQLAARIQSLGFGNHSKALNSCRRWARTFECEETGHIFQKILFCGRPFCTACGEYGSPNHERRAGRLMRQLWGIRIAKWVITFPPENLGQLYAWGTVELQKKIADLLMEWEGVRACKVALHWLGDRTQREHFEGVFPHSGRIRSKEDLKSFRVFLRDRLGLSRLPTAHLEYVDRGLPAEDQNKKWCHSVRYAAHPSVPAARLAKMDDEQLRQIVGRVSAHGRTIRGYGDWGDRRIGKTGDDYRNRYPMPEATGDLEADVEVIDGEPCPLEDCCGVLKIRADAEPTLRGQECIELAPDLYYFTGVRSRRRRREVG